MGKGGRCWWEEERRWRVAGERHRLGGEIRKGCGVRDMRDREGRPGGKERAVGGVVRHPGLGEGLRRIRKRRAERVGKRMSEG